MEPDVVDPTTAEHRHLTIGFGVVVDLEHVQLGALCEMDDDHAGTAGELGAVAFDRGVEDVDIERLERVAVVGDGRNMIDAL